MKDQHIISLHAGPTTLLTLLSEHYFVIGARQLVKTISQRCVTCQRSYLQTATQMMGQLLETRIKPSPPFSVTGIDFAGPFTTKRGYSRKPTHLKSYVCFFLCFATKCIHLEFCSDLSTASLMAALTRFVGRRGLTYTIYTDNGTNFVGPSCELSECYELLNFQLPVYQVALLTCTCPTLWWFVGGKDEIHEVYSEEDTPPSPPKL